MTTEEAFNLAYQHHVAGRLAQAEPIYRQILAHDPNHADAMHMLGAIAHHGGDYSAALGLIGQAIRLLPDRPSYHSNFGMTLTKLGRREEALAAYGRALALDPGFANAHGLLGNALLETGKTSEAITHLRQAVALNSNSADLPYNLAIALMSIGESKEAVDLYRRALALRPGWLDALNNLGFAHQQRGELEDAAAVLERAVAIAPDFFFAMNNLVVVLSHLRRYERAIALCQAALVRQPDLADLHYTYGYVLSEAGRRDEAADAMLKAVALKPNAHRLRIEAAKSLQTLGRYDEAVQCFRALVGTASHELDVEAYWHLAEVGMRKAMAVAAPADSLPRLPYLGDKVVLVDCDRSTRELLRQAGLHGGYAIDPADGAESWLASRLAAGVDDAKLTGVIAQWLDWSRNEAAMAGTTCTAWMPEMPGRVREAFRQAAGDDLIEIAGGSAEEIHAQLCDRAARPLQTEDKIFAIVSIRNGGLELLPHWLEHYTKLGVDELLVGVFDDLAKDAAAEIGDLSVRWKFRTFVQHWTAATESEQYTQRQTGCRKAGASSRTWILHTDLDEFHCYPALLQEITAAAARSGINAIVGNLVDRVSADGSLPSIGASPSLWEQYPVECRLTEHVLRGRTEKLMLARYSVLVRTGHHEAVLEPTTPPPIGAAKDYRVAHFKWHGGLLARLRWGVQQSNASFQWKTESNGFLGWLDRHGGRIDLSDPALQACNSLAPDSDVIR